MRRCVAVLAILCLGTGCTGDSGLQGDVVLHRTIRLGNAGETEGGVMYWGARIRVSDNPQKRVIIDLDAKTLTYMDKEKRTYMVRTLDEVGRMHQRATGSAHTTQIVLARTDATERIAGYETRQYTFATERVRGAVWVSEEVRPQAVWREWETLIAYFEGTAGGEGVIEAAAQLGGYPLRTVLTFGKTDQAWTITTRISAIALGAPAEDLTNVPEDFQRANDIPLPG